MCQIPLHPNYRVPEKVVSFCGGLLGLGPRHYLGQGYGCCIVQCSRSTWMWFRLLSLCLSIFTGHNHSLHWLTNSFDKLSYQTGSTSASKTQIYFRLLSRKGTKSRPWRLGIQCVGDTFCSEEKKKKEKRKKEKIWLCIYCSQKNVVHFIRGDAKVAKVSCGRWVMLSSG